MRNSSSLDWLRFMHTPNDYRVSPFMGKENIGGNDIYIQMEQTFITGYALCSEGKYEEADPYLETAYKLACQLPYEEGFKFRICTVWNFLSTLNFIDKGDLYIEYVEK